MGASEKRAAHQFKNSQIFESAINDSVKPSPENLTVSLLAVRRTVVEVLEHKAFVNMEPWLIQDIADDVMWSLSGGK